VLLTRLCTPSVLLTRLCTPPVLLTCLCTPSVLLTRLCTPSVLLTVRGAAAAAARIGGVFGVYTTVRCFMSSELDMPMTAPFIAGGVAVALPTALDAKRGEFLQAYFKHHMGQPVTRSSVVFTSAVSGAILLGSVDSALRYLDWQW
jgi:hypothetical protein